MGDDGIKCWEEDIGKFDEAFTRLTSSPATAPSEKAESNAQRSWIAGRAGSASALVSSSSSEDQCSTMML